MAGLHVSTTRVPWQGDQLSLTISLGCASMKGQEGIDYLLMMADRALYQAKEQGRNRVVISTQ
ncbi:GGDEF domain-containing protein [Aeromonas allosaccharophila]|uniref:GGDEF domain-containing protein n=1 Tax=Aeromonas allosaccharophila TaxID=656 RepID=UPI003D1E59FE